MTYKVRYAYRLLVDNYCPEDEIFLFGFSRGAFAARAIADFVDAYGILKKPNLRRFDSAWKKFLEKQSGNSLQDWGKKPGEHVDTEYTHPKKLIRCIGVWDTVGSLGPPPLLFVHKNDIITARAAHKRHGRFNLSPTPKTTYNFQALALDESRFDFYPAVWSLSSPEHASEGYFAQTWFPGVHSDVGGGKDNGFSQYTFTWMVSKLQAAHLLDLDTEFIESAVITPIKSQGVPPWNLLIGGRDYVERSSPKLGALLPACTKRFLRTAPRNPFLQAASSYADKDNESTIGKIKNVEQTFHWTVLQRIENSKVDYWTSCPALRDGSLEEVREREDVPVGLDRELRVLNWTKLP